LSLVQRKTSFLVIVIIFSLNTIVVSADEPNLGILRVRSFQAPTEVALNSVFSVKLDVEYGVHGRPENDTFRAAIYGDNVNDPLWQSEPVTVWWAGPSSSSAPWGGDKIWNINLTSPSVQRSFKLTAYAYYFDDGVWRFFNNSLNGPGLRQVSVRIGKTANFAVELGTSDVLVSIDNLTVKTSSNGDAKMTLFEGNTYVLSVPPVVEFQNLTRLVFSGWDDGSKQSQRSFVFDGDMKFIGSYRIQYLLQVNSLGSSYSEWHDAGSSVRLQTLDSVPMNSPLDLFGFRYNFVGWTGDINSSLKEVDITMNAPKTFNANFSVDYSPLLIFSIFAVGVSGAVILLVRKRRNVSNEPPSTEKLSLRCGNCGERVEGDWTHCIRCGMDLANHKPIDK
jgi:hypothetical protein